MHEPAIERGRIVERLHDAVAERVLAPRQAGETALAGGAVAGRAVDQHLGQPVVAQKRAQLGRRILVGRGEFDPGEAGARRRREAVEKRQIGKQKPDIGAESRYSAIDHTFSTSAPGPASSSQAFTVMQSML